MRFASIVGARPQFVKVAPVSSALRRQHEEFIIHTGQHYDYVLSAQFFEELAIPEPAFYLGCGSGNHGAQTAMMLESIEKVLLKERVDWVIAYGDTNSTLAGALAAAKLHISVAHVEAGLRSFNRAMPEEINRIVTDHLSDRFFCPTETGKKHLKNEGITNEVYVPGDVMYDTLLQVQPQLDERVEGLMSQMHVSPDAYVLATVHRAANTDDPAAMHAITRALNKIELPVIFPMHPRTRVRLLNYDISWGKHVQIIEPVGYLDMLALQRSAFRILTDSGGIQKEAFLLGTPCITLREETEWVETVELGWNVLTGANRERILEAMARPEPQAPARNPFGKGDAALRIAQCW